MTLRLNINCFHLLSNVDKLGHCRRILIENALLFSANGLGPRVGITLEKEKRVKRVIGAFVCITQVSPQSNTAPAVINTQLYLLEWIAKVGRAHS